MRRRRVEPTPGSTTARCTDPPPKCRVPANTMNAPAETSKRGTSCETSTKTAVGHPASTTPLIAATSGEPAPKGLVKVTTAGDLPLPETCHVPGVRFRVKGRLL